MQKILCLALAAGLTLGTAALANAQGGGVGGAGGAGATTGGSQSGSTMNKSGTTNRTGTSTTGQGQRGPGASQYAPGRNPGTASERNPGHGGTPPGQRMKDRNGDNDRDRK